MNPEQGSAIRRRPYLCRRREQVLEAALESEHSTLNDTNNQWRRLLEERDA
jgi:hypothetical protein